MTDAPPRRFRSRDWFDDPDRMDMTALYLERFMNYGTTPEELRSGRPIIGIAQTGSDLNPCNRIHVDLARRVRDGIRDAGGIPIEFPTHPTFENCKRPTAAMDRNLAYLGLVEILYGYPIDAVVLTTGCDKTTPSSLMAAATVDIPAIVLSGGPMLDGWHKGELAGSGTVIWRSRRKLAAGEITEAEFLQAALDSAPSLGHCNTMGTASTMNALAEALGMSLTGCAAISAPYRERGQIAYRTGKRIVEMAHEDLRPSHILTRAAFLNAIRDCVARISGLPQPGHLVFPLREADVLRTPEFQHPVQCVHGNGDLGRSTPIGAGSQPIADDPLEATDVSLHQGTPVVAGGLLPGHVAALGNDLQVPVSHRRRRLGCVARHGAGAWRDDDGRLGMTCGDLAMDAVLIVSPVGGERGDRAIHLIEQGPDLRGIVDVAGGQRSRRDLPGVGVHGDVQLAPIPACLRSMFLEQPFA